MKNIYDLKNKIVVVLAYARVVVQKYGHRKKFAKHVVAFAIKQLMRLSDCDLAGFLGSNRIGKLLGYGRAPHKSTFSKVRSRSDPQMFLDVYNMLISAHFRGKVLRIVAQDSSAFPAFSRKDTDARFGYRTPSKREQEFMKVKEATFEFGYKLHSIADAESDTPLVVRIVPANFNDKTLFNPLYSDLKADFRLQKNAKFLADAEYHASRIRQRLRDDDVIPVIPESGNRYRKTRQPKDPDYAKRWAVERIFSRLKEVFGLEKNRMIGIGRATIHAASCLLAYAVRYVI